MTEAIQNKVEALLYAMEHGNTVEAVSNLIKHGAVGLYVDTQLQSSEPHIRKDIYNKLIMDCTTTPPMVFEESDLSTSLISPC